MWNEFKDQAPYRVTFSREENGVEIEDSLVVRGKNEQDAWKRLEEYDKQQKGDKKQKFKHAEKVDKFRDQDE